MHKRLKLLSIFFLLFMAGCSSSASMADSIILPTLTVQLSSNTPIEIYSVTGQLLVANEIVSTVISSNDPEDYGQEVEEDADPVQPVLLEEGSTSLQFTLPASLQDGTTMALRLSFVFPNGMRRTLTSQANWIYHASDPLSFTLEGSNVPSLTLTGADLDSFSMSQWTLNNQAVLPVDDQSQSSDDQQTA